MNKTIDRRLDTEQLVADLAWEYCERSRRGEELDINTYLQRCPDAASRENFTELVNTDLLLSLSVQTQK